MNTTVKYTAVIEAIQNELDACDRQLVEIGNRLADYAPEEIFMSKLPRTAYRLGLLAKWLRKTLKAYAKLDKDLDTEHDILEEVIKLYAKKAAKASEESHKNVELTPHQKVTRIMALKKVESVLESYILYPLSK